MIPKVLTVSKPLEIPEEAYESLDISDENKERFMKVELAVSLYSIGVLPYEKAVKLSGVDEKEFKIEMERRKLR